MTNYAISLNKDLEESVIFSVLSKYGKNIYLPKGIIVQGAEAKGKRYNATIGIATDHGVPMHLDSIMNCFSPDMKPSELFPYMPSLGKPELREAWKEEMIFKNPTLKNKKFSLPLVTAGLTHALYIVSSLFIDKNDAVIMPDMYWENYDLIFKEHVNAKVKTFKMFKDGKFNTEGLGNTIDKINKDKVVIVLNFPNNPSGYTPSEKEQKELAKLLTKKATKNKKLVVIMDDAYYSLFYEKDTAKESLFAHLVDANENLFAIKCDAATKEEMVWGFRVSFITFGYKGITDKEITALSNKFAGAIRGCISNSSTPGQNILLKAMQSPNYHSEKQKGVDVIKERYFALKKALEAHKSDKRLQVVPFNSGYFMSFYVKNETAEELRMRLLEKYDLGAIAIGGKYLRIAFSSIDVEDINEVVERIYKAAK